MSTIPHPTIAGLSGAAVPGGTAAVAKPPSLRELRLVRLLATLFLSAAALFLFWTILQSVFLALQVQRIAGSGAAAGLAWVVGVGAIGALVSAPIAGALSDRTRTRIGGRAPWMLAGAAATFVLAMLLASATSIAGLALYWLLIQVSTNFIFTPIMVHIPDRVPVARRGIFSAAVGLANLMGILLGQVLGAAFAKQIGLGYLVVSAVLVLVVIGFVLTNGRSNIGEPRPPLSLKTLLGSFWVNPVKYPAFGWTFLGRFLFLTGFFPLKVYLLYILQSYVGLGGGAVASLPAVALAAMAGSALSTPLAGWASDRLGITRPLIYLCSGVMVCAMLVPLLSPTYHGMLAYSFLVGAGFGGFASVDYVLITKVLPSQEDAGKDLGIINMTTTLSQTLGVGMAGAIVSTAGSYGALFAMGIVLVLSGAACIGFVRGVK